MYLENNFDISKFDQKFAVIQASQIFEKPQTRSMTLSLCGVPFQLNFQLDATSLVFSLFLEGKSIVENRLITLDEFLDTNPTMTMEQLCLSVVELLTRHAEDFMIDPATGQLHEDLAGATRGFIEQEL